MPEVSFTVHLDYQRCPMCGKYYAVENRARYQCPYCAEERVSEIRAERNRAWIRCSSLKGVVTKLRKAAAV